MPESYPLPRYACSVWQNPTTGLFHVCTPPRPGEAKGQHHVLRTAREVGEIVALVAAEATAEREGKLVGSLRGPFAAVEFDLTGGHYHQLAKPSGTDELVRKARAAMARGMAVKHIAPGVSGIREEPRPAPKPKPAKQAKPTYTLADLGLD